MIKNYLKIALRNIRNHKGYSFINIFGLAVGMACCILILLWVQDELSYDRFHEHRDRIYRVALGASVSGIVFRLMKAFMKWVLIANFIAWPIAYIAMGRWLQGFAYRIDIGLCLFVPSTVSGFRSPFLALCGRGNLFTKSLFILVTGLKRSFANMRIVQILNLY